jgi:hypothetical protein
VVDRLREAGCVAPKDEADALVGAAPDAASLEAWTRRRERGEPLAWIVGGTMFYGRWLRVDPSSCRGAGS